MTSGRFQLADLDGILVEKVLDHMAEQMKPATGQQWDSLEHRKADALVELCRTYADVQPTGSFRIQIVTHRRADGTADCAGFDLAPEALDAVAPALSSPRLRIARVCPYHHRMLVPHGRWHLVGQAEQIDGLRLVHADELAEARAGPGP